MKFRFSKVVWENINKINEKYHISCTEVDAYEDLEQFFSVFSEIASEPQDELYVNYVFDLNNLCYDKYDSREEFLELSTKLREKYQADLEKLIPYIGDC